MKLLLTNVIFSETRSSGDFLIVYFNPWGFSRTGIKDQVRKALSNFLLNDEDVLYIYLTPYFFGRRSKIVVRYCLDNIKSQVQELNFEEFELLFNDSSV